MLEIYVQISDTVYFNTTLTSTSKSYFDEIACYKSEEHI